MTERPQPEPGSDVLTSGDVAAICGVSFRTVLRWIERGLLEAYKLPGRGDRRVRRADLQRFMQANGIPDHSATPAVAKRVLVVEDDPAMARAIERVLRRAGYETRVAVNGFEAGAMLSGWQPGVMTLDLRMPGMDGLDVLRFLHSAALPQPPKVLVVSADSERRLQAARELGAHGTLNKPFRNEDLRAAVDKLFS